MNIGDRMTRSKMPMLLPDNISKIIDLLRLSVLTDGITPENAQLFLDNMMEDMGKNIKLNVVFDKLSFILSFIDELGLEKIELEIWDPFVYENPITGISFGSQ